MRLWPAHGELHRGRTEAATSLSRVTDNGLGIPVEPHPKFPKNRRSEVIMCTLMRAQVRPKVYETSGGLHGSAFLSSTPFPSASKSKSRGGPALRHVYHAAIEKRSRTASAAPRTCRGTKVRFKPDGRLSAPGDIQSLRLFKMARAKAYLFRRLRNPLALRQGTPARQCGSAGNETFLLSRRLRTIWCGDAPGRRWSIPDCSPQIRRPGAKWCCRMAWPGPGPTDFVSVLLQPPSRPPTASLMNRLRAALSRALKDMPSASIRQGAPPR